MPDSELRSVLPTVNAGLNLLATVLLLGGYWAIRRRREALHKGLMLTALGASVAFLACYLVYHVQVGSVRFAGPPGVRVVYLAILASHVILAAAVPVLAVVTVYLGIADRRAAHRRWARWTYPIWLYVSVTGVVIYVMLYHVYPPAAEQTIIGPTGIPVDRDAAAAAGSFAGGERWGSSA